MNRKTLIPFLFTLLLVGCKNSNNSNSSNSEINSTSEQNQDVLFVFDSGNSPSFADEVETFTWNIKFNNDEEYIISYSNVSTNKDNHIMLSDRGYIQNLDAFPGINKVTVNYTGGTLKYYCGYSTAEINEIELSSGVSYDELNKYSYFKLLAIGEVVIKDITFEIKNDADNSYQYVESYENDHLTVIEKKEFKKGSEVDTSLFKKPSPIFYEDKEISFLGYALEEYENVSETFILGDYPVALYPVFEYVQRFSWTHDIENQSYISLKAGVRPIIYAEGKQHGRYSADFEICNTMTTGIGLVWNCLLPDSSYPYANECSYYYFHLNPNNGGFQFSKVDNGTYTALKTYPLSTNKYWNAKWDKWNSYGRKEPLVITMTAEFSPKSTSIYIDGACIGVYTNEEELSLFDSTVIGIRTNSANNIAKNFKFIDYVSSENGFNKFNDDSYVSYLNNVSTVVPNITADHLKFSADMTITSTTNNVRSGLMIRAYRPLEESTTNNWTHQSGYYMHHNVTANANFTAISIYDNEYSKHPDGSTGNIGSIVYNSSTDGVLGQYYQNNVAFFNGESSTLSIRISFELTNEHVAIYLNDSLIFIKENSSVTNYFDNLLNNSGVGFVAGSYGVKFSYLEVINYDV